MTNKERIITRYLSQRWYKKALIITPKEQNYFYKINVLKLVACSGYLKNEPSLGCVFDVEAWPFEHKFFDLIILDESFINCPALMKAIFNQLHFCLADDGEVIVACSGNISLYSLISRFISNGFISKRVRLINYTGNFIVNMFKRIFSKYFVVVFKKDNYFSVDPLSVGELIKEPTKSEVAKIYSGGCAKEVYGNFHKEK
ncbi:class I SAM-dependent methyltransferase [Francisella salimarina]|uniref:Class I SAM-dependent methyltransferase n=1 Tax=Francisella salimarina TaxID=2599927 RepID=A0AAJ4NPY6_9GAMM|nr:class I SAM-dependent methyltransferase [Francisella salimarina]QWU99978.1 class I SAM-dependent methyltransferase [Francisella salimarina]